MPVGPRARIENPGWRGGGAWHIGLSRVGFCVEAVLRPDWRVGRYAANPPYSADRVMDLGHPERHSDFRPPVRGSAGVFRIRWHYAACRARFDACRTVNPITSSSW